LHSSRSITIVSRRRRQQFIITLGSVGALLLALFVGVLVSQFDIRVNDHLVITIDFIGKVWVALLMLLVIPLSGSYLLNAILSINERRSLGRLGLYAVKAHLLILLLAIGFSCFFGIGTLELLGDQLPRLSIDQEFDLAGISGSKISAFWLEPIMADLNTLQRWIGNSILGLMFLSVVMGFSIVFCFSRYSPTWSRVSKRVADRSIHWLSMFLVSLPLAVFALMFPMMVSSGISVLGVAIYFVVILCILLIVFIIILHVIPHAWGVTTISNFFRGLLQTQMVAVSTRSSLATIPSLMEAAENNFDVDKHTSGVIIPFFVTIFRLNKGISSVFKYIFLVYAYNLELSVAPLVGFIVLQLLASFGTPGIPSGGKFVTLPIYLAAGIPLEGLILLKAVDAIPDVFKTILNVTEVMTVTVLVKDNVKQVA